jgi:antitoxin component YwqK of YwqJK toxin-antitoxin module
MKENKFLYKIAFTLALCIGASLNIEAQNKIDKDGLKTGIWKGVYENGKLRYQGQFEADFPVGTFTYYYNSGELKMTLTWINNFESQAKLYYQNKELMAEGNYLNKKRTGNWITYGANKVKVTEGNYLSGKKYELWKTFYPNGKVSEEVNFEADLEEGDFKSYFETGELRQKAFYVDGYRSGKTTLYYGSGSVRIKGQFKKDVKDGIWVYYNEDQSINRKVEFDLGKRITPYGENELPEDIELFREKVKDDLEVEDMQGTIRYDKERK